MSENSTAIELRRQPAPLNLWAGDSPRDLVGEATAAARALAGVIEQQKLFLNISGRRYVRVEGWTLLGMLSKVFPHTVWTRALPWPSGVVESGRGRCWGWEARVEARTLAGVVVGSAEAMCCRDERMWAQRDDYALRSMAATRATGKAMRLPLGYVMALAGYEATPAEEMPRDEEEGRAPAQVPLARTAVRPSSPSQPVVTPSGDTTLATGPARPMAPAAPTAELSGSEPAATVFVHVRPERPVAPAVHDPLTAAKRRCWALAREAGDTNQEAVRARLFGQFHILERADQTVQVLGVDAWEKACGFYEMVIEEQRTAEAPPPAEVEVVESEGY